MSIMNVSIFNSSKLPDEVVVERVLAGEKALYEILLRRYNQTLFRVIRTYLNDEHEVQDAMQETYVIAYQKLFQFQGKSKFSTWLIRIGINEALGRIREKHRSQIVRISDEGELYHKVIQLPDSKTMNPEQKIINHDLKQVVEKAIDELPEKYRLIYILREIEGLDNPEIANCLGISESNVKVRFHRAKKMLKEVLFKFSVDATIFEFGNSKCDRIVDIVMKRIATF